MSLFLADPPIFRAERLTKNDKIQIYETIGFDIISRQDIIEIFSKSKSKISKHQIFAFIDQLIEHQYIMKTSNLHDMRRIYYKRTERIRNE